MTAAAPASNLAAISAFFASKGLPPAAIAGIEGNLQVESNFSPTANNPNEGAIGIAQWEGGRRAALDTYAGQTGGSETSLTTQLGYLWKELTGPFSGVLKSLQGATDPTQAATVFDQSFEISSPASLPTRVADAKSLYAGGASTLAGGAGAGVAQAVSIPGIPDAGSIATSILKPVFNFALNAVFIGAGVGLVILGFWKIATPAGEDSKPALSDLAPLAMAAA